MNTDPIKSIREKFKVEDGGQDWLIKCPHCKCRWALKKSSDAPGNILHLLNHAAGHEKGVKNP